VTASVDWLPVAYAALMSASFLAYALMDGWDLGVGIFYPLVARAPDRDHLLETIAPFWDANETWLVLGGMLLLLGFPLAYAVLLTKLYLPVFAMLFALVLRGVSYEFRQQGGRLREFWGHLFAASSVLAAFAQGCILGRVVEGIAETDSASPIITAIRGTFPLACGVGLVGAYALLGACWVILKTQGAVQVTAREVARSALILTVILLIVVSLFTPLVSPHVAHRWFASNDGVLAAVAVVAGGVVIWRLWMSIWGSDDRRPLQWVIALFILSFAGIAASVYPYVVPYGYTLFEAANDRKTLVFAAVGICIVLPVIVLYLALGYRVFRGKSQDPHPEATDIPCVSCRRTAGHEADLHPS